ncbi:MAG TPA: threonine synthase [Vicinamibacterales bacterium]|nr:threonine synthase [Vicinamibacterales bacterium]
MPFVSTRHPAGAPVTLADAIQQGLAPGGGLYVPVEVPVLAAGEFAAWRGRSLPEVATALLAPLVADTFDVPTLGRLMAGALDFPMPLVPLAPDLSVLELFRGPTLAFKDVGARTMARWLAVVAGAADPRPLTVLVATSGDTGGAVAHAFRGVGGTRVVVLYPRGRVSPVQEAQFATLGGNVTAVAVDGVFDDCQRMVKQAFADAALARALRLTSANSINIGRLLPQMAYYAWAALQLPADAPPPIIVVPSGNLGNLTAGVLAQRRGVPIGGFVAATAANDPLPRFLASGRYEPRPSVPTLASAMDVGAPSNFERLSWLYRGDVAAMRAAMTWATVTDDDIRAAVRDLADRFGYLADPHTAVAYLGRPRRGANGAGAAPTVILATAHAAKFQEVVEPALARAVPLPPALAERLALPSLVVPAAPTLAALTRVLATLE